MKNKRYLLGFKKSKGFGFKEFTNKREGEKEALELKRKGIWHEFKEKEM